MDDILRRDINAEQMIEGRTPVIDLRFKFALIAFAALVGVLAYLLLCNSY
jgi:hypothetical protein